MKRGKKERMQQLTNKTVKQVNSLIEMGILQVTAIDEDGNFCYGCTDEGYKIARGESNITDYTNDECKKGVD